MQYATGYHQGPVAPPRTDGAQLLGVTGKQALLDGFDAEMMFFSNGHLLGYLLLTNCFSLAFCQTQKPLSRLLLNLFIYSGFIKM